MIDLETPHTVVAAFEQVRVKLPLRLSDEDTGVILDDDGADILTVDVNGIRDDEQVTHIASLVVSAINLFAGLKDFANDAREA